METVTRRGRKDNEDSAVFLRWCSEEDDLIELLWCNGHVVMQSQSHRKVPPRPEKAAAVAAPPAPASVPQEDEGGLWFPFALADSLDKDIFSEFFCEAPTPAPAPAASGGGTGTEAGGKSRGGDVPVPAEDDRRGVGGGVACAVSAGDPCDLMPPPKSTPASCSRQQTTMSLANGGDNAGGDLPGLVRAGAEAGASSMLSAIGSSICGSNQVLVQRAACAPGRASASGSGTARGDGSGSALPSAVGSANANAVGGGRGHEASSSGRSNYCCFGATTTTTTTTEPASTSNRSSKRKRLDTEDSESPSEVSPFELYDRCLVDPSITVV
jgi:phytochrome-interacting factor 4